MKRLMLILLAVLLLAGCSREQPPQETGVAGPTSSTECTPTQATEPGLYIPDSAIEQQTDGAVRAYALEGNHWFGLASVGTELLLTGENTMLLLSGEQGWTAARTAADTLSAASETDTYTTGVAYYSADSHKVTVLDTRLQQVAQLELPETVIGTPVISLIRNEVYYFTGADIRAMNITTGISRLLRQQSNVEALLPDDYFDGNVLSCRIKDSDDGVRIEYFSSETGQTFSEEQGIFEMRTVKDRFFIRRMDNQIHQMIFGTRDGEPQSCLASMPEVGGFAPVLEMNGVVSYEETEGGLSLFFYNLATGKRTAQISLAGVRSPAAVHCDGTYVWVLAAGEENQTLFRWEISKSPVQDEATYTGPFYTADNPDADGLKECQTLADTYAKQYGVKLNIWQNAMKVTGDYTVTPEYQPQVIKEMLEKLQPTLALFLEKFLLKTVEAGWIQIGLVRSINDGRDWVHFWQDGDCWILVSSQADVVDAFTQGVAYAIDSHVLGNSRDFDFDRWNPLNPADFTYANSYDVEPKQEYLEGDTKAFTDALAMSYIHEDRCRVFYNAMLSSNADMFSSPTMQAKLERLCMGIREAYGLQKNEKTYAWEQYLETSLAYVKN